MRLDRLAEEEGEAIQVEWRSFLLRPFPEARTREAFVAYTESWRRPAAMEPEAQLTPWSSGSAPPSHSVPAAVAAKVASGMGVGAWARYHRALFRAYFSENRTISEPAVLVAVAAEVGLDAERFGAELAERRPELEAQVFAEHNRAIEAGITAVPAVVVGHTYLMSGAVEVEEYRRLIDRHRIEVG